MNYRDTGGGPAMPSDMILYTEYITWFYEDSTIFTRYLHVFYSVICATFGGGIGPVSDKQVSLLFNKFYFYKKIAFGIFVCLSGFVMIGILFAKVSDFIGELNRKTNDYKKQKEELKYNLKKRKIDRELKD